MQSRAKAELLVGRLGPAPIVQNPLNDVFPDDEDDLFADASEDEDEDQPAVAAAAGQPVARAYPGACVRVEATADVKPAPKKAEEADDEAFADYDDDDAGLLDYEWDRVGLGVGAQPPALGSLSQRRTDTCRVAVVRASSRRVASSVLLAHAQAPTSRRRCRKCAAAVAA